MGLVIVRPKPHLGPEVIAGINKSLRRLPEFFEKSRRDGFPPVITFDPNEVDVFGTLAAVGVVEPEETQTEVGGQVVQRVELQINLADFV